MKIIITGGAGFIGSNLADELIGQGHQVVVLDNLSTGSKKNLNPRAKFYKADVCSPSVFKIFEKEKPEVVFHFAAQIDVRKSAENPIEDARINILGGINILENCKINKVKKVIFSSTGGAMYGNATVIPTPETYLEFPLSPYGIGKLTTEKYLNYYYKVFNLPFVALRFANVYGPRQNSRGEAGVVAIFLDKILNNQQPVINGNGKQTRDFIYVDDVVKAVILAMNSKKIGIFNIGTGKETDINEIFDKIKRITGSGYKKEYSSKKPEEQKRSCLDYSKAGKELNWEPKYNIEQGLEETTKWFIKKNGK